MSHVVHRNTFEFHEGRRILRKFKCEPLGPWVKNPDMSAVDGLDPSEWKWQGDRLVPKVKRRKRRAPEEKGPAPAVAPSVGALALEWNGQALIATLSSGGKSLSAVLLEIK